MYEKTMCFLTGVTRLGRTALLALPPSDVLTA